METIAHDEHGKALFYISVYYLIENDPKWLDFNSSLPDFIFELCEIKPFVKEMLCPEKDDNEREISIQKLVDKLIKSSKFKRWYFPQEALNMSGKFCRPYYEFLTELIDGIDEPTYTPFSRIEFSIIYNRCCQLIHVLMRDEVFEVLDRKQFEDLICDIFPLQLAYVDHYSLKAKFYKQKSSHEINNRGIAFVFLNGLPVWAFIYVSSKNQ